MRALYYTGTTGLNEIIDPVRLEYNPKTGVSELAQAVNVDITDSGRVRRRLGQVSIDPDEFHSLYCNNGDCFVVMDRETDAAIFKVNTDLSLTGVRSGLSKGQRISFWQEENKTYYSSLAENGVIVDGISSPWPTYTEHIGPDDGAVYSPAPLGQHIAVFQASFYIANGPAIWVSEPWSYNKFNRATRFFQFGTDVIMVRPVETGIWFSTTLYTAFLKAGTKFSEFELTSRYDVPAHEWSACHELVYLKNTKYNLPGQNAIWSCDKGLCIGTPTGELIVTTEDKLLYPNGPYGATVADGAVIYNTIY